MPTLQSLFDQGASAKGIFRPDRFSHLPPAAQRYLGHAIATGTTLASSVRLTMTGEIKLKKWMPFTASQVVQIDHGFIWKAKVKSGLTFLTGFDQYLDGVGACRWKLLGLFKVMDASGPDISRSAEGRFAIERVMMPSAFCLSKIRWTGSADQATAVTDHKLGSSELTLDVTDTGMLRGVSLPRWGNPEGGEFALRPFGALVEAEATFAGYTIPTQLRVGWGMGTPGSAAGEFFRCTITGAEFRY